MYKILRIGLLAACLSSVLSKKNGKKGPTKNQSVIPGGDNSAVEEKADKLHSWSYNYKSLDGPHMVKF